MKIAILPLCALSPTNDAICALPFGEAEHARLLSMGSKKRKTQSLGALLALRSLMGSPPLPICRTPAGKPYFDAKQAPAFSLAHTDRLAVALLGEAEEGRVGVDAEELRPFSHKERITTRFFTTEEQEILLQANTDDTFFKLWTSKEATAKLEGIGLAALLSNQAIEQPYLRHFRIRQNDTVTILCLAAEHPIQSVEWYAPPDVQIQEI